MSLNEIENRYPKSTQYVREHLVPGRYCNKCDSHVLKSDLSQYPYQCVYCDEDLYSIETHIKTNDNEEISDFDFGDLIETVVQVLGLDDKMVII